MVTCAARCPQEARLHQCGLSWHILSGSYALSGAEVFTNLDYADDVSLLVQMAQALLLALDCEQMVKDSSHLQTTRDKTKIQTSKDCPPHQLQSLLEGYMVEVVAAFKYLGSHRVPSGSREQETKVQGAECICWECHADSLQKMKPAGLPCGLQQRTMKSIYYRRRTRIVEKIPTA